jgi:hypothetical protein
VFLIDFWPVAKNQSNAHIATGKNPFFQNFFYSFTNKDLREFSTFGGVLFSHQTRK